MKIETTKKPFKFMIGEIKDCFPTGAITGPAPHYVTLWLFCEEFKNGKFIPREDSLLKAREWVAEKNKGVEK